MGLDWMLRPAERAGKSAPPTYEELPVESETKEVDNYYINLGLYF